MVHRGRATCLRGRSGRPVRRSGGDLSRLRGSTARRRSRDLRNGGERRRGRCALRLVARAEQARGTNARDAAWREDREADRYLRFSLSRRGALLFAAMCIIWGIPYLMIRVAVRELAPVTMVFLRTGIAAALLVPLAARRGELRPLIAGWRPLLAYTAIEVALPWYLLGHAETKLTSSLTGLLIAAVPLVAALIVTLSAERARLGLRRWLGLLVGIVGVGAIVGLDIGNIDLLALGEVALVAICYAVGPLILARRMGGLPALGIVSVSLALSALFYALTACSGQLAGRVSVRTRGRIRRRPRGRLLGGGVPDLLRVDQGGGPAARDGDHLRESGRRSGARGDAAERVGARRHGDRLLARARGLHPGDGRHPRSSRGAVA